MGCAVLCPALPAQPACDGCETKAWEGNRGKKKGLARGQLELAVCLPGSLGADCAVSLWVHGRDKSIASRGNAIIINISGLEGLPLPGHRMGKVKGPVGASLGCEGHSQWRVGWLGLSQILQYSSLSQAGAIDGCSPPVPEWPLGAASSSC